MSTMKEILVQCGGVLGDRERRMLSYLKNCPAPHWKFIGTDSKTRAYFAVVTQLC